MREILVLDVRRVASSSPPHILLGLMGSLNRLLDDDEFRKRWEVSVFAPIGDGLQVDIRKRYGSAAYVRCRAVVLHTHEHGKPKRTLFQLAPVSVWGAKEDIEEALTCVEEYNVNAIAEAHGMEKPCELAMALHEVHKAIYKAGLYNTPSLLSTEDEEEIPCDEEE